MSWEPGVHPVAAGSTIQVGDTTWLHPDTLTCAQGQHDHCTEFRVVVVVVILIFVCCLQKQKTQKSRTTIAVVSMTGRWKTQRFSPWCCLQQCKQQFRYHCIPWWIHWSHRCHPVEQCRCQWFCRSGLRSWIHHDWKQWGCLGSECLW